MAADSKQSFQPSLSYSTYSPSTNLKISAVFSVMFEIAKFPRELRDMIYEAALVQDVINVAPTEVPKCENVARSTWQDTRDPSIARPGVDGAGVHEETVTNLTTYKPNAGRSFYKLNMFDFSSAESAVTATSVCLAFLNDRPQQALRLIRRMHLSFGEPLHHQASRFLPGPLSPQWGQLCTKISANRSLHHLVLSVNGVFPDFGMVDPGNGGLEPWVQEICKVTHLRKLEVDVTSKAEVENAFDLINYLRARMLLNGSDLEKMGHRDVLYTKKVMESRPWLTVSNFVLPKKYSADGVLLQCPSALTATLMEQLQNATKKSLSWNWRGSD